MSRLLEIAERTRAWPKWGRYAGATGLALIAYAFQLLLRHEIPPHLFMLSLPAVLLAVALFGGNPGGWSIAASASLTGYFLLEPAGFAIADRVAATALVLFIATSVLLVVIVEELFHAVHRLGLEETAAREALARAREADRLKDLLLQDMAHRTKNDLQLLSSMLQIEGRSLEEGTGRASLLSAASRIAVVSRVHSLLQRGGPPFVEMKPLVDDLCADLRVSHIGLRPIAIKAEVEHRPLPLHVARSTALIMNELVTNALKHAFPGDRMGTVTIRLASERDETVLLVRDDGVGLSPSAGQCGSGFGQQLVRSLAHHLGGVFTIGAEPSGTSCELRFPTPPR